MSDRRHLVATEIEKLLAAVKGTRNAARDRCLWPASQYPPHRFFP